MNTDLPQSTHPVSVVREQCVYRDGRAAKVAPGRRCRITADVWLYGPDKLPAPGACVCSTHGHSIIDDMRHLGEIWYALPLVYPCEHRCDPRKCEDCRSGGEDNAGA